MIRRIAAVACAVLIGGCATYAPSVPEGYSGPRAELRDSALTRSRSKADFFVAEAVNGAEIKSSLEETRRRNQGRGMWLSPYVIDRPVIAGEAIQVAIKGRTYFAAPIQALTGTVYQVSGIVEFVPRAEGKYVVRGELGEKYSAVWIEDAQTKEVVGQKIEAEGTAKLGFFEK